MYVFNFMYVKWNSS